MKISQSANLFTEHNLPREGEVVGYVALITALGLEAPLPYYISCINGNSRRYKRGNVLLFTSAYKPEESLRGHLFFALKYEGVQVLVLKKLFEKISTTEITEVVEKEMNSQWGRKIWFLYEWLTGKTLPLPDLRRGNYVPLLDDKLQFTSAGIDKSFRHKILNNLPGVKGFCPLVYKTDKLNEQLSSIEKLRLSSLTPGYDKELLQRATGYLMLKDSRASFTLEGENPAEQKIINWSNELKIAGTNELNKTELLRLQEVLLENNRFVKRGFRTEGGFVGEHHPRTGMPLPEHISCRAEDTIPLTEALLEAAKLAVPAPVEGVVKAAAVAFGFVFIHPFEDGNGRVHRYIFQHLLSRPLFPEAPVVLPLTSAILERAAEYKKVLEAFSHPLLKFIKWQRTESNNVEVLNDTADYYGYFDATVQAEFTAGCVVYALQTLLPVELDYLKSFDSMSAYLAALGIPAKQIKLLISFLNQNNGSLSVRARKKEFASLTDIEIEGVEQKYLQYFGKQK